MKLDIAQLLERREIERAPIVPDGGLARCRITKVERNWAQNSAQRISCLIRVAGTWHANARAQ